jgi:ubiquinone/menaquinone biosynthesis C-methylase UbiE
MPSSGLLGDTATRDYARKLQRFNAFAEIELRAAIASLTPRPGMRVLDAGCGTGEALCWWRESLGGDATLIGIDLATSHARAARERVNADTLIVQASTQQLPLQRSSVDIVWCINTINHLRDPLDGIAQLAGALRAGGRIALGQSSLVPDMYFAWDARLEHVVNEAVRRYYRERYHLDQRDLTAVRGLIGLMQRAQLRRVQSRTFVIERTQPLRAQDEAYLLETIFQQTWGERLRPYLADADFDQLTQLCDPHNAAFALRRPDFHFLQTFTLVVGEL